jgi:peptidoglycan hydrolase-like protein with peptidoglycan-binding domain
MATLTLGESTSTSSLFDVRSLVDSALGLNSKAADAAPDLKPPTATEPSAPPSFSLQPVSDSPGVTPPQDPSAIATLINRNFFSGLTGLISDLAADPASSPSSKPKETSTDTDNVAKVTRGDLVLKMDTAASSDTSSNSKTAPSKETIQKMQHLLQKTGYLDDEKEELGTYDQDTEKAVIEFQKDVGINQDGRIGVFTSRLLLHAAEEDGEEAEEDFKKFVKDPKNKRFILPGCGKPEINDDGVEELYQKAAAVEEKKAEKKKAEEKKEGATQSEGANTEKEPEADKEGTEGTETDTEKDTEMLLQRATQEVVEIKDSDLARRYINSSLVSGTQEGLEALQMLIVGANNAGVMVQPHQPDSTKELYQLELVFSPFDEVMSGSSEWYQQNLGWSLIGNHGDREQRNREAQRWMERNAPQYGFDAVTQADGGVTLVFLGKEGATEFAQKRQSQHKPVT